MHAQLVVAWIFTLRRPSTAAIARQTHPAGKNGEIYLLFHSQTLIARSSLVGHKKIEAHRLDRLA